MAKTSFSHIRAFVLACMLLLPAQRSLVKAAEAQFDELEECLRDFDTEIVGLGGISLLGTVDSVSWYNIFTTRITKRGNRFLRSRNICRLQIPVNLGGSHGQAPTRH